MKNMLKQMLGAAACCAICTTLPLLPASAAEVTLGDVNADSAINATDASEILVYATEVGAGTAQAALDTALADVNGDGTVNALDASDVLVYTSKTGSGYTGTMEQHIRSKKNFEYYHTLSDYEVYVEYCEMYGFEAEEELPSEEELPDYQNATHFLNGTEYPQFLLYCDVEAKELKQELNEHPENFGFPSDWYENVILEETEMSITTREYQIVSWSVLSKGTSQYGELLYCLIEVQLDDVSYFEPDSTKESYFSDMIDLYRMRMTLQNSDAVQMYLKEEMGMNIGIRPIAPAMN